VNPDKDYYRILGVLDDAEDVVIRAAYRALAQRYHPDKWQGDAAEATRRMAEINAAYAVLSDTEKRAAYDATRDKNQFRDEPSEPEDVSEAINKFSVTNKARWLFGVLSIIGIVAAFVIPIIADKSKSMPTNSSALPLVEISPSYGIPHAGNCFLTWDGFNFILAKPDQTEKFEAISVDDKKQGVKVFIKKGLSIKDMEKIMGENYRFIEPLCRVAKK
jgi:curved DNA-binding protein CbpA